VIVAAYIAEGKEDEGDGMDAPITPPSIDDDDDDENLDDYDDYDDLYHYDGDGDDDGSPQKKRRAGLLTGGEPI
jgi:hypothetical protein